MSRAEFERRHPGVFYLEPDAGEGLTLHLRGMGLLDAREAVTRASVAGEGNMNRVLRVVTSKRSLIVKQSRPWVAKYPQFDAPFDRALVEAAFYELAAREPAVASRMPCLLAVDPAARLLVLEDLGTSADYTALYAEGVLEDRTIGELADYLSALHAAFAPAAAPELLANREMRALNAHHIFEVPLDPAQCPDLDGLQPGLAGAAAWLQGDDALRAAFARLGREAYLADGPCLLHGDVFPGSLLRTPKGLRVIDPEFAFFGRAEFDVGVLLAHLLLAEQPAPMIEGFLQRYRRPPGFENGLMCQLAGVEVIRRLLGFGQLPLARDVAAKEELLARGRRLVLRPGVRDLVSPRARPAATAGRGA